MFDLDGTLLPFDLETFTKFYLGSLSKDVMHLGYEPKELINNILKGTYLMIKNDGSKTNKEVFWNFFESVYGKKVYEDEKYFDRYYETTFKEETVSILEGLILGRNEIKALLNTEKPLDKMYARPAGASPDNVILTPYGIPL